MLDVLSVWTPPLQPPGPLRALTSALFHSALAALAIKPPIA
ncbi:hypothetical protein [Acidovorax sp.]